MDKTMFSKNELMESILSRFIERNVADSKSVVLKPFDMKAYESTLSVNSIQDFQVIDFIWTNYGLCSFKNGLFQTINPADFNPIMIHFPRVSPQALPLIKTATGSFLVWDYFDDEWVIMYLDIHTNSYSFYGDTFSDLFNFDLISDTVWLDELNGEREFLAIKCFPDIQYNECVLPISNIDEGTSFTETNLRKVSVFDYFGDL